MNWAVVETYYEHGEYKLTILTGIETLRDFVISELTYYGAEFDLDGDIIDLIELVEEIGTQRVENQEGWGFREIRQI